MAKRDKRPYPERRRAKIEEMVGRDKLSAGELKGFIDLVCGEAGVNVGREEEMWLPNIKEPSLLVETGYFMQITLLDGRSERSGEKICLQHPLWHTRALSLSYRSKFLNRRVHIDTNGELLFSEDPLSKEEHSKVANLIWAAYLRGVILRLLEEHT